MNTGFRTGAAPTELAPGPVEFYKHGAPTELEWYFNRLLSGAPPAAIRHTSREALRFAVARSVVLVLWIAICACEGFALDEVRPPGNRPLAASVHALIGGRVVVRPGKELEKGTIILRDGRIVAVGADAAVPADARVHDMAGTTIYAGFIDAHVSFAKAAERARRGDG